MKYLVMCEGSNKLTLMQILLDNNLLIYNMDDLLGLSIYHARQIISNAQIRIQLNMYPGNDVIIHRIGDVQSDILKIPSEYKRKVIKVEKYCTKPELEMLLIISQNLTSEFNKVKSVISPKEFAKSNIFFNKIRYNNSSEFYRLYFQDRPQFLAKTIEEYKRNNGGHKKEELYLADLLKNSAKS